MAKTCLVSNGGHARLWDGGPLEQLACGALAEEKETTPRPPCRAAAVKECSDPRLRAVRETR